MHSRDDDSKRRSFLAGAAGKFPTHFVTDTPGPLWTYTEQGFHSSAQNALGLQLSRLTDISGRTFTNNANCPTDRAGEFGCSLKTATGVKIRRHQAAPWPPFGPAFKLDPLG